MPTKESSARTVVVFLPGDADVLPREPLQAPPSYTPPGRLRRQVAFRNWASELGAESDEALAQGLDLPRLQLLLERLARRGAGHITVLLVGTDQSSDPAVARFIPGDTGPFVARIATVLPDWAGRRGLLVGDAAPVIVPGNPSILDRIWGALDAVVQALGDVGRCDVHVLSGGAPAIRDGLRLRILLSRDLGVIERATTWSVSTIDDPPVVQDEAAIPIISRAALLPRLQRENERSRFDLLSRMLDDWPVGGLDRVKALARIGAALLNFDVERAYKAALASDPQNASALEPLRMPPTLGDYASNRGALADIEPLHALMLEVLAIHCRDEDVVRALEVVHLVNEYLPHLAWQQWRGHALDPKALAASIRDPRCFWKKSPPCQLPPKKENVYEPILTGFRRNTTWKSYLEESYSRLGAALHVCLKCPERSCTLHPPVGSSLADTARLIGSFDESKLVKLRHTSPAGHFFEVPSSQEMIAAWNHFAAPNRQPRYIDGQPLPKITALRGLADALSIVVDSVAGHRIRRSEHLGRLRQSIRSLLAT